MKCENCEIEHNNSYGSGRFCSSKCARGFSTKNKRLLINKKVSEKLKGQIHETKLLTIEYFTNVCPICHEEYKTRKKKRVYCSQKCARQNNGCCESAKKKISIKVQERIKNGTFSGWTSRKGRPSSYPELYFIDLFNLITCF